MTASAATAIGTTIGSRKPGSLLKQGLEEMSKFLAARAGAKENWSEVRVVAYLNQHVLGPARGHQAGVRDIRDLAPAGIAVKCS